MHLSRRKRINVLLIICSIIICNLLKIDVSMADWYGSATEPMSCGEGCSGGGGGSSTQFYMLATGYRVSVLKKNGKPVAGTISVDYWPSNNKGSCSINPGYRSISLLTSKCHPDNNDSYWLSIGGRHSSITKFDDLWYNYIIGYKTKKPKTNVSENGTLIGENFISMGNENRWNFVVNDSKKYSNQQSADWLDGWYADSSNNNNYAKRALEELFPRVYKSDNKSHDEADYKYIAQLMRNCGYTNISEKRDNASGMSIKDAKKIIATATKNEVYLAIEPVMAFQVINQHFVKYKGSGWNIEYNNEDGSSWNTKDYDYVTTDNDGIGDAYIRYPLFLGTPAEMKYLGLDTLGVSWAYPRVSYLHPIVYAQSDTPKTIAGIKTCKNMSNSSVTMDNAANPQSCLGIFIFNIKEGFSDCSKSAKKYIDTYLKSDRSEKAKNDYIESLSKDKDVSDCISTVMYGPEPKYETTKCNILDPKNLDMFNGYDSSVNDNVCDSYSCQTMANLVYNYYKTKPDQIGVEGSEYETRIADVKKEYDKRDNKDNNLLMTVNWQNVSFNGKQLTGPTCAYEEIKNKSCPVNNIDAKCKSSGNSFTLSDTNDISNCIKTGVAYNNLDNNGNVKGGGNEISESSEDTIDNNGNCMETVIFSFPGNVTGIEAGTVFTWGTKRSITGQPKSEIFGTMTVERTCYLSGKSSISMKWADNNINPKIALYYKEAIPSSVTNYTAKRIDGTNLTVENITKKIDVYTDESGTKRIGGNSTGKTVNCGNNCNNARRVDMEASYDIKYGSSFLWNYNRNLNDTSLTLEKSDSENNYYTAIGYGLPTSFVTPAGMKGNYKFGSSLTSNDGNGYMYVKVNNVGTCKNSASNECHFNKYITFALTDDNDTDKSSIYYKCKFDIKNKLFGTEDGHNTDPNVPPKGLDVVFRTVQLINKNVSDSEKEAELNKAFPGRSGNGRYTSRDKNNNRIVGSNWLKIEKNEADNTKRIFEILSNMVYAQEPAYHIVLDTTKINYIRRNNVYYRSVDLDPYTNNQQYKFDKTNSLVYAYGASDFITDLINRNWLDGACVSGDTDARAKRGACRQS